MSNQTETSIVVFTPGMHGHFLRYVICVYIYGQPKVKSTFNKTGASHIVLPYEPAIGHNHDVELKFSIADKIVRIVPDVDYEFILFVNIFYRCHGILTENYTHEEIDEKMITELHRSFLKNTDSDIEIRTQFLAKLQKNDIHPQMCKQTKTSSPLFEFTFKSFFSLTGFLLELRRLADFLGLLFLFDESLVKLHKEFIHLNQGYQFYTRSNYLLECSYIGKRETIEKNNFIHAYMNSKISDIFHIHDGALFDEDYPVSTVEVYNIIKNSIAEYKS